jgi:hypothetical protein
MKLHFFPSVLGECFDMVEADSLKPVLMLDISGIDIGRDGGVVALKHVQD